MEEGTPDLETFTESVGDGPSQPLMRKLMSMMLSPPENIHPQNVIGPDSDISGFFLVNEPPPLFPTGTSSGYPQEYPSSSGCPVEDMENVVQSGFRFPEPPWAENYFSENRVPTDIADKVPIDLLHAINNVFDTKVAPIPTTHHHSRRRHMRRARPVRDREHTPQDRRFEGPPLFRERDHSRERSPDKRTWDRIYGQEMILRRLDRLEEITLRTESYLQTVLGTMDRRLHILEADILSPPQDDVLSAIRQTQDSMTSPRFPGTRGIFSEAGTFVTPDMLSVQSPHPDRLAAASLEATAPSPDMPPFGSVDVCLSPIDTLPSPALFTAISTPVAPSSHTPEYPFSSSQEAQPSPGMAPTTPRTQEVPRQNEEEDRPQVAAVAIFTVSPEDSTDIPRSQENLPIIDGLLSAPVVTWENDGFPYLRPAYRIPVGPPLRDTTVLTWDSAGCLPPESPTNTDVERESPSSDDAFLFYNFEDRIRNEEVPSSTGTSQDQNLAGQGRNEEVMLGEISSILKNIHNNLDAIKKPPEEQASTSSHSYCHRCGEDRNQQHVFPRPVNVIQEMIASNKDQEEIISVLEEMFTRLAFFPSPENVLVNILPTTEETKREDGACISSSDCKLPGYEKLPHGYTEVPQHEDANMIQREQESFEILPQDSGAYPKLLLSFSQDEDTSVKLEVQDSPESPVNIHVQVAPRGCSSAAQDICVNIEGPYQEPVMCENRPVDDQAREDREMITVSEEELQLTDSLTADYTLKVVPERGEIAVSSQDQAEVSSVVHELCFQVDIPKEGEKASEELPLQIGLTMTGEDQQPRVVSQSLDTAPHQQPEVASLVFTIDNNDQRLNTCEEQPLSFNWEGLRASEECEDIPCLVNRTPTGEQEHHTSTVREEVCISMEVPACCSSTEVNKEDIHIEVAVKSLPTTELIHIPEELQFQKAPLSEMPQVLERGEVVTEDEMLPLMREEKDMLDEKKNILKERKLVVEDNDKDVVIMESILAPPPSPVEASPETHEYLFKEEKKAPTFDEEYIIETSYLPVENLHQADARIPKMLMKGFTTMDLFRGSLHFDGKTCLLSISSDDIWTADDMCITPVKDFTKIKSRTGMKAVDVEPVHGPVCGTEQTFGFRTKHPPLGTAFGFRLMPVQKQPLPVQQPRPVQPQQVGMLGFRAVPMKPPEATVFGFRTVKPPVPVKNPAISVSIPEEVFPEPDSSLSVVSRSPGGKVAGLPKKEQPAKPRVPDSPGAGSCTIDGDRTSSTTSSSSLNTQAETSQATLTTEKPLSPISLQKSVLPPAMTALDFLEAAGISSEDETVETQGWEAGLDVLPLEVRGVLNEETFFDALQCSAAARNVGGNNKIKRYFKDKLWSKLSCYGVGLPESESSDAPCGHHERV